MSTLLLILTILYMTCTHKITTEQCERIGSCQGYNRGRFVMTNC